MVIDTGELWDDGKCDVLQDLRDAKEIMSKPMPYPDMAYIFNSEAYKAYEKLWEERKKRIADDES